MQIHVASSIKSNIADAISEIQNVLWVKVKDNPNFLFVTFPSKLDAKELQTQLLKYFPESLFSGVSSCPGAFDAYNTIGFNDIPAPIDSPFPQSKFSVHKFSVTEEEPEAPEAIIVMAFYDRVGVYGNKAISFEENNINLSVAIRETAASADRLGVMPDLIYLFNTPEANSIMKGELESILGSSVPCIGGVLDNIDGSKPKIFTQSEVLEGDRIYLLTFMYPDCEVFVEGNCAVDDLSFRGKITKLSGNVIEEVDNQPAADVFFKTIGIDSVSMDVPELQCLMKENKFSYFVGKHVPSVNGEKRFNVSCIVDITDNRGLLIKCYWKENDILHVVKGNGDDLDSCFITNDYSNNRMLLAMFHVMCNTYCSANNSAFFKQKVLKKVREYHKSDVFMVCSEGGEYGKSMDDRFELDNYSVATVCFMSREG